MSIAYARIERTPAGPQPVAALEQRHDGLWALRTADGRMIGRFTTATEAAVAGGLMAPPPTRIFSQNLNADIDLP